MSEGTCLTILFSNSRWQPFPTNAISLDFIFKLTLSIYSAKPLLKNSGIIDADPFPFTTQPQSEVTKGHHKYP